jgi:hypothetical protein
MPHMHSSPELAPPSSVPSEGAERERSGTRRAVAELEEVEHDLEAARAQRREMDIVEARLWSRRNRLEHSLVASLGADWWHQHKQGAV